jgi:hypothetical protein
MLVTSSKRERGPWALVLLELLGCGSAARLFGGLRAGTRAVCTRGGGSRSPAEEALAGSHRGTDPQQAAWRTAVEAAPWLVGPTIEPEELYETLTPLDQPVAGDIEASLARGDE